MASKNVITRGDSIASKATNTFNSAMKNKYTGTSAKNPKANTLTATDISVNPITVQPTIVVLKYTDYPPFSNEQRTRVIETYKSIEDKISDEKMAKIIQDQFLADITMKSESYLERVEDGEDIEDIRTEQSEFLNGLIEGILGKDGKDGVIDAINASKANAEKEMKEIVSKIIVDLIKNNELTIGIEKIDSTNNNKIAARVVISHKKDDSPDKEVIYEGPEVELWKFPAHTTR